MLSPLLENYSFGYARMPPGFYMTHELEFDDGDGKYESFGLGDFLIYNWTVLFIPSPLISIQEKTLVLIGHIISVQMGCQITRALGWYWRSNMLPGVPCPVVFVSLYALLIDHFYEILWEIKSAGSCYRPECDSLAMLIFEDNECNLNKKSSICHYQQWRWWS